MGYCYGPVPSRRLGLSLGIDLTPAKSAKVCTFNCIYCQLGGKVKKTVSRFSYLDLAKLGRQVKARVKKYPAIDYLTLSGRGEPTLHKNLAKIIAVIKQAAASKIPVCESVAERIFLA